MARKPRIHVPGGVYHVMLRGNDGQDVFVTDDDRHRLYELLERGISRYRYRVHSFCFMKNHIHFAIQAGSEPLSKALHNLSFRYTQWVNKRYERTGHLFQGRYKAILVDVDHYLLELVRYIHLNPVRAGLVEHPEQYYWSGHRTYLGKQVLPWLTTEWVLGQFGERSDTARRQYIQFVKDGYGEVARKDFQQGGDDTRLLGDDEFINKALRNTEAEPLDPPALEVMIDTIRKEFDLVETELKNVRGSHRLAEARAIIGWLAIELGGATLTEVGRRFDRGAVTMSESVARLRSRMEKSPALKRRCERLLKKLSKKRKSEA